MRTELDVLQHLAMEGIAETADIVAETDHGADAVRETLATLETAGYVEEEGFWYLTDEGEARLAEVCRERFDEAQLDDLASLLSDFESLDRRMKELAEAWQTMDEADRGPTADPVVELRDLQADLEAAFDALDAEARAVYEPSLSALASAIDRLEHGETEYFTATDVDSYHTVWFELHDDLLRTCGEERTK